MIPLLVFACGALYEAACVGWVHFSERGKPLPTALFSMLAAAATVTGILDSVRDWHVAPAFILGYGAGSYAAVEWKRRNSKGGK
jgi:hypothetical protein